MYLFFLTDKTICEKNRYEYVFVLRKTHSG